MTHGPSDQWEIDPRAMNLEERLDGIFMEIWRHDASNVKKLDRKPYPRFVDDNIKRRWIEFAYERGDLTYLRFTQGQHIIPKVVTYERDLETGCEVTGVIDKS